jgi:transposase
MQDIERREDGSRLKQGVSPDRVVSVHDPEMRHGHKSERRRFDGHKARVAVDPESQLITAADVLAGNAPDHERALELVEQAEANAEFVVEEVVGDCAYGDGDTRRTFAGAGRKLVAKVATRRGGAQFPKEDFRIDLEVMSCVCPAGQKSQKVEEKPHGLRVLARRWVVERTSAWLGLWRRFRKDYERLPETAEAMIYGAMSRLMVRRLARAV